MYPKTLKHWLVSCEGSLTSWREGASLALVGHPSSNGVTIKLLYVADALHQPALYSIFSYYYLQWFIRKLTEISLRQFCLGNNLPAQATENTAEASSKASAKTDFEA